MNYKENLNFKYWDTFYKNKKLTNKATKFAVFCYKRLKNYDGVVYDLGSGNGRDVVFFNKNKINCIGVDKSFQAIVKSKKHHSFLKKNLKKKNFCNFFQRKIKNKKFSVYSRFTLHAINYRNEKKLFMNLSKQKNLEYLFIETRTIYDELYGKGKNVGRHEFIWLNKSKNQKTSSSHYRRFIEPPNLYKLLKKNFNILYFKKSRGFAKFKKENPCVLRVIAKKKRT